MLQDALVDFDIEKEEYGYLMEASHYTNKSFKIRIPKLMPLINQNCDIRESYNTNIFENDSECKLPNINKVTTQNYLTINRAGYSNLAGAGSWNDDEFIGTISAGQRFLCTIIGQNIRQIFITDAI